MNIPFELMIVYGFIEKVALVLLILTILNVANKKIIKIFIISIILLSLTLITRQYYNNYLFLIFSGLLSTIIVLKISYRKVYLPNIVMASTLSFFVLIIFEMIFVAIGLNFFNNLSEIQLWLVTGIPHITMIFLLTYLIYRIRRTRNVLQFKEKHQN